MRNLQQLLKRDGFLLVVIIALVTAAALPVLTYPLGRDQGEFATIGRGILDGRVPYRDLWNPKPPAIFYVYGLAMNLFGRTTVALRALDLLIVPGIMAGLFWLGRRVENRGVGLWAALLFGVFYFTETFWTLTQNDGLVLLPMVLALVSTAKAADLTPHPHVRSVAHSPSPTGRGGIRKQIMWAALAGVLGGYVIWFKYPFALFTAFLPIAYLIFRYTSTVELRTTENWKGMVRESIAPMTGFMVGVGVVLAGGALYMMSIGAWDDLMQSAQVTSQYTALTFNLQDFGGLLVTALAFRWQHWGLLWILAAVGLAAPRLTGSKRGRTWWVIGLWLVVGTVIMASQAKAYDYHWLPMLPPLALLGADAMDRMVGTLYLRWLRSAISSELSAMLIGGVLLAIMGVVVWRPALPYLTGQEDQVTYYNRFVAGAANEFVAGESLQVATALHERVAPGDSLFIWGFRPEVYYLSGLNPGARFIFHFPLVGSWYPTEWKQELVDTLWASMPPYALVLQVDYMPWVTGSEADSNTLLQGYTELNNWLIANYDYDSQIGNFFLWRRKP